MSNQEKLNYLKKQLNETCDREHICKLGGYAISGLNTSGAYSEEEREALCREILKSVSNALLIAVRKERAEIWLKQIQYKSFAIGSTGRLSQ